MKKVAWVCSVATRTPVTICSVAGAIVVPEGHGPIADPSNLTNVQVTSAGSAPFSSAASTAAALMSLASEVAPVRNRSSSRVAAMDDESAAFCICRRSP